MKEKIVVVGGGIAGIQAALDLGDMGFEVHLLERSPSIGGHMAQLDKTFPTNDCSLCILSPKMIMCADHENIKLHTYSEIEGISGKFPHFKVKVREKARYIDVARCTGCGDCTVKCPMNVPSEYEETLSNRKAIYLPFPQAVPRKVTIDANYCRFMNQQKCGTCKKVCQAGAIDYDQKDKLFDIDAAAIVFATGYDQMDLAALPQFGFSIAKDVVTSLQFERILSASGPTAGHLIRPSDLTEPKTLAFIQCVGSRDVNTHVYCSSVCCMYATKESILAGEHAPNIKTTIFYMDMRAVGKNFQEFVQRAKKNYGVRYVQSRPAKLQPATDGKGVLISYERKGAGGEVAQEEFDMAVLCPALEPSKRTVDFANKSGLKVDSDGFFAAPDIQHTVDSTSKGIVVCGFASTPMDIPDAVVQASSAAARVAEMIVGGGR